MTVYKTGSVSVTSGSAVVTGSNTRFLESINSGDLFRLPSSPTWYEIASVNSDTQLMLSSRYSNTAYNIKRSENIASTNNATKVYSGTLGYTPVIQSYVVINASNVRYTDDGAGVLTGTPTTGTPVGTVDYDTGAWSITTATTYAASVNVSASYYNGQVLTNTGYRIVRDFTPNYAFPEMSPSDANIQQIYTRGVRKIDEKLADLNASIDAVEASLTGVSATNIGASGVGVYDHEAVGNEFRFRNLYGVGGVSTSRTGSIIEIDIDSHINASDPHSLVDNTAYGSEWNGSNNTAPSRNTVYDKIELVVASLDNHESDVSTHGVTGTILGTEDVDDSPADGVTNAPISSNWAFDHINASDPHMVVDDTAYGSEWNGSTDTAPSRNAVYDKIETLGDTITATNIPDSGNEAVLSSFENNELRFRRLEQGEGIDIVYNASHILVSIEQASYTNIGGAKFNSADFAVSSGNVSLTPHNNSATPHFSNINYHTFIMDGGGDVIATGIKGDWMLPAGTLTGIYLLSGNTLSGTITVDIWSDTYANFPATNLDSIASDLPTISSSNKYSDTSLGGWSTSISESDIWRINVDNCSTLTRVSLIAKIEKS